MKITDLLTAIKSGRIRITDHADEEVQNDRLSSTRYFHRYFQVQLLRIILMINHIQVVWWQGTHLRESLFIVYGHITQKRNGQCWLRCTDQTRSEG